MNTLSSILNATDLSSTSMDARKAAAELKIRLMKQLTWLMIFFYALSLLKPAIPVFMDVLAHTFWEQQHLMTVHEVNGKFHVHYQVVNAGHQSDKDKSAQDSRYETDACIRSIIGIQIPVFSNYEFSKNYLRYTRYYSFSFLCVDNPPPDVPFA